MKTDTSCSSLAQILLFSRYRRKL